VRYSDIIIMLDYFP